MDIKNLTKKEIIENIRNNKIRLFELSYDLKNDIEFFEKFKDDKEVVLEFIKKNGMILYYVSERLKDDKDVVLKAIRNNVWAFEYASDRLKDDRSIVLVAINNDGSELKYASNRLKDTKEVVLEAVKNNILALQYASDRLQNDKQLLEMLKKEDIFSLNILNVNWYEEKMKALDNIKEKELMEDSITFNNISTKKLKF